MPLKFVNIQASATNNSMKTFTQKDYTIMKIGKQLKTFSVVGFGMLGLAVMSASGQTINQSGGSGTTYTGIDEAQGSANALRAISFATIANDANNLYITLGINPTGNLATGGAFNYIIGITTGNPSAGGDLSTDATTHGNAYDRDISFSSAFGGMTDFVGIFGAGGSGSGSSPYTSYGFNDYVYGTPTSTSPAGKWTGIETKSSGEPLSDQPSTSIPNEITVTVPLADFADNLSLTPGTTIDFDIDSTGTAATDTAYGSLADPTLIQPGVPAGSGSSPFSNTYQFNETELDQYTITAVPEPGTLALAGLSGLSMILFRRRK
jgi:PEP-CTERM motif-containing protein